MTDDANASVGKALIAGRYLRPLPDLRLAHDKRTRLTALRLLPHTTTATEYHLTCGGIMGITDRLMINGWIVTMLGMVLVLLASLFGFEEPVQTLVVPGAVMIFLPLLCVAGHVALTRGLNRDEKRRWIRELVSWQAAEAFTCYVHSTDRRTALRTLLAQRRSPAQSMTRQK